WLCLRRGQERDVRAHDTPALAHTHPGLALSPAAAGLHPLEFRVGGGEVSTKGGDHGMHDGAGHVGPGTREPRGVDRREAVAVVRERVADGARIVPEARVEHVHVVGVECPLVALEGRAHLGHHLGQIDLHVTHLSVSGGAQGTMRAAATPSRSRAAATRKSVVSFQGATTSCTPTGSGPGPATGTDRTGRPMKDRGCVYRPSIGRAGTSTPPTAMVSWPIRDAGNGVVGARSTST